MLESTAFYVSEMNLRTMEGMATAGPFDTWKQADAYITAHAGELSCPQITAGPADLGPEWEANVARWRQKLASGQ